MYIFHTVREALTKSNGEKNNEKDYNLHISYTKNYHKMEESINLLLKQYIKMHIYMRIFIQQKNQKWKYIYHKKYKCMRGKNGIQKICKQIKITIFMDSKILHHKVNSSPYIRKLLSHYLNENIRFLNVEKLIWILLWEVKQAKTVCDSLSFCSPNPLSCNIKH
jgi:hypothetical protein